VSEPAPGNVPEYAVGELARAVKRTLETGFQRVRVRGEIAGFKRAASGHAYWSLKDMDAAIDAVAWRAQFARLKVAPEDGLEVIATGHLTTYPKSSKYQLVVEALELAGAGALLKLLEERKRKLGEEGLFDPARKKPIPYLPDVIGVVTSPTGAVIRDILHRLAERFPRHVLVWPVLVQGEGAAAQVAAAIDGFNALPPGGATPRPDLLIVARGGGSLEDLWAFNEEIVVRAAARSAIPLISAVGHETDTTLIDFAADLRAPTPTAAAEKAVPVRRDLLARLSELDARLAGALTRGLDNRRQHLQSLARGLGDPRRGIETAQQRLDHLGELMAGRTSALLQRLDHRTAQSGARLVHPSAQIARAGDRVAAAARALERAGDRRVDRAQSALARVAALLRPAAVERALENANGRLAQAAGLLDSYSYQRVLERGFVLVQDAAGHPIVSAGGLAAGQPLALRFHDGEVKAVAGARAHATRLRRPGGQGTLF
jgi:exodeoxyribonuclease VII large subunit